MQSRGRQMLLALPDESVQLLYVARVIRLKAFRKVAESGAVHVLTQLEITAQQHYDEVVAELEDRGLPVFSENSLEFERIRAVAIAHSNHANDEVNKLLEAGMTPEQVMAEMERRLGLPDNEG